MSFVLRKIAKAKWHKRSGANKGIDDEIQADAFSDLKTQHNELSVWHVEDDQSNLETIITALASNSDFLANVDYVLIDQSRLTQLNISLKQTNGDSPYHAANIWHRDLVDLSGEKLFNLTKEIYKDIGGRYRKLQKDVTQLLVAAITSGNIDSAALKLELRSKIERFLPPSST